MKKIAKWWGKLDIAQKFVTIGLIAAYCYVIVTG